MDGKDYETVAEALPDFKIVPACHADIWYSECRLYLITSDGNFYAPPFESQQGEYEQDDWRIMQTKVLREVVQTFHIREALVVDFRHAEIIRPEGTEYGTIQIGEAIAFAATLKACTVDPDELKRRRAEKRYNKLKARAERGGKKTRSKRKR